MLGKKPNPFLPIIQPSKITILFLIIVFLIITLDPIEQLSPIITFFSIIELCPIQQFFPILTSFIDREASKKSSKKKRTPPIKRTAKRNIYFLTGI